MTLSRIREQLKTDFFKSFTILVSGNLVAQGISYLIAPILTRLYSTSEMGELAFYMRIIGLIASIATLRYELALPLPKRDSHSFLLYRVSLFIGIFILGLSILVLYGLFITRMLPGFNWWYLLFIALGAGFLIFINVGTNWSVRTGEFRLITQQKISNSIVSNSLKWVFVLFNFSYFGLILSTVLGFIVSSISFAINYQKLRRQFKHLFSRKKTVALMRNHREFPLINLPHVLVDNGRDLLVALLIFIFFSESVYGSFNHSYSMLRVPLMLIGVSLGQIFYNQGIERYNSKQLLMPLFRKTILLLTGISILPFTILFFFGEPIFTWVFGTNWGDSGRYSEIMSYWLMVNFIVSPVSVLPLILAKQRFAFLIGIISALIQVIPLWVIPYFLGESDEVFVISIKVISILQIIWLIFSLVVYIYFIRQSDLKIQKL